MICRNVPIGNPVVRNITLTTPLSLASGFNDVWETGYPGIGVRLILWNGQALTAQTSPVLAQADSPSSGAKGFFGVYSALGPLNTSMQLVKTGPIATGRFPGALVGRDYATEAYVPSAKGSVPLFNSLTLLGTLLLGGLDIVVSHPTCNLDITVAKVVLDTFQLKNVPASHEGFGYKDFLISAVCQGVSIASFTFSGTPSSADGHRFANMAADGAKGIDVGLAWNINGQRHILPANDSWDQRTIDVDASSGTATLPLSVSYWRTGTPTAGAVSSDIMVVISYQ
ncbi:hypothetical protein GCM10010981_09340 [Dyella nitratireducens]|uniref:Fimbrial-type adhesion domain-containing protein n=2 Tax=Dyella nitratireducens TaxID=1849580 RepID=A0ABQ1FPY6_9GAMM|nr:hypothetical protein GCM10010981_09340 [Dyella nitratireducens]GLQ44005.1 hypothetical protein GCM10007902_38550 [Dyella nitratireducens]